MAFLQPSLGEDVGPAPASDACGQWGLPLGVLRCGFDALPSSEASPEQDPGESDERHAGHTDNERQTNDSARKIRRWLDGLHDVVETTSQLPRSCFTASWRLPDCHRLRRRGVRPRDVIRHQLVHGVVEFIPERRVEVPAPHR